MRSGGGRIASTVVRGSQQQTHTVLEFYPTKITSSSAASGRPLKRQRPIRENTHDDLRKCFTNNTTSKSAGKNKSYNTDKLAKHGCKNEIPENDQKRGCLPNAEDVNKGLGLRRTEKTLLRRINQHK